MEAIRARCRSIRGADLAQAAAKRLRWLAKHALLLRAAGALQASEAESGRLGVKRVQRWLRPSDWDADDCGARLNLE